MDEDNGQSQLSLCPGPFVTAALYCREPIMKTFLERKPYLLNAATPDSFWTPLMFSAANGSKITAQFLIECGADADRMNALNRTALDIACACGHPEVKAFLANKTTVKSQKLGNGSKDRFFAAVRDGNVDRVGDLLSHEIVDVDMTDEVGATALMIAAMTGHLDIVKLVLDLGAELDKQDKVNGWTPLMQATFYGHKNVSRLLIENGADPTIVAFNGCTALDLAALMEETDTDTLRMLAKQTIEFAPPTMRFDLKRKSLHRSMSSPNLSDKKMSRGFKSWLGKVANLFKKLKEVSESSHNISINIIPESNDLFVETVATDTENDQPDHLGSTLFTLGFSAATTDLSSYMISQQNSSTISSIPSAPRELLESTAVTGHFRMPDGLSSKLRDREKNDVTQILNTLFLQKYTSLFREQEIDLKAFKELDEQDLQELGVTSKEDRLKLLNFEISDTVFAQKT